jgi:hypothetical protein
VLLRVDGRVHPALIVAACLHAGTQSAICPHHAWLTQRHVWAYQIKKKTFKNECLELHGDQPLWETFVCTTLGFEVPVLASLPRRNQRRPPYAAATAHSGATKAHDWAVGVLGPLFGQLDARSGLSTRKRPAQANGVRSYLRDAAGSRSLVFDLSITHDRIGSSCHVQQKGLLSHPRDLDAPLRLAAQRKIKSYRHNHTLTNRTFLFSPPL